MHETVCLVKTYTVLRTIVLSFLTPQDQYDTYIDAEVGYGLESDGVTIWLTTGRRTRRIQSITTANAIDLWLKNGSIMEA